MSLVTTIMSVHFGDATFDAELQTEVQGFFSSHGETLLVNVVFLFAMLLNLIVQGGHILALFVLGLLAGKHNLHQLELKNRRLVRRIFVFSGGTGLALCLGYGVMLTFGPVPAMVQGVDLVWGSSLLGLGYLAGVALLYSRFPQARLWLPFAAVGRMSLSNYLFQSLVMTLLFYPYGLGLAETIGPAVALGLGIIFYAAQALVSLLWLKHFRFGPVEWFWRSLTYRQRLPLRMRQHGRLEESI